MSNGVRYHLDNNFIDEPKKFGDTYIIQVGRLFCGENKHIEKHFHHYWYELTVVNKGEGAVITDGVSVPVKSGDIFFSFPKENHEIIAPEDSSFEFDFFSFYTENEELNREFDRIVKEYKPSKLRVFDDENVKALIINLMGEFVGDNNKMQPIVVRGILDQLLGYIIRDFSGNENKSEYKNVDSKDIFCYHVMKYIDENIYNVKDLSQIEKVFNYNYSYMSDLFSKTTGRTLSDYFRDKRLGTAKSLIEEGKLSINEISSKLNYSSVYSFSKAFKEKYKISPIKFKPKHNDK